MVIEGNTHIKSHNGIFSRAIQGRCEDIMQMFPDKHFDLAIIDPPYFSGPEKRKYYGNAESKIGVDRIDYPVTETWRIPDADTFNEVFRVSKQQIIWGCNYFDYKFGSGRIIWDKVNGESSYSDCEIAYCSLHDSTRLLRYMWNGMQQGKSIKEGHIQQGNKKLNEKKIHPTQKPVKLYQWLLQQYAKPGDTILDTHLGSGSSRIAAYSMGFDFTGIELAETHYNNANARFEEYVKQKEANLQLPFQQGA